jgi:secreted Zn-dependent insulinase-like peptidase
MARSRTRWFSYVLTPRRDTRFDTNINSARGLVRAQRKQRENKFTTELPKAGLQNLPKILESGPHHHTHCHLQVSCAVFSYIQQSQVTRDTTQANVTGVTTQVNVTSVTTQVNVNGGIGRLK